MKNILVLISQGVEILEVSPFIDVFGWNMVVGKKDTLVTTCSFHDIINCTWNIKILPEINLKNTKLNLEIYDALVIPGGFGKAGFFNDMKTEEFQSIIQHFHNNNKIILGVCTGVISLGESGILKNKRATTYLLDNDRYFKQLSNYGAIPVREEIVIDDNIITSSASKNALETAFILLEKLTSKENMENVKYNMGF
ncbi:DJ-1/PfpI family protein [Fusobacterium ulcerans]|jgi:4-methyl-5(b-hydroxyethyl)-thiazole monophosphate biosynthesis|uniref:DJ-1/PfpI family protein n=1 Tax=Fusobacterium ulcerans TaxID=861 RepID=UPI000E49370A|nr:DJ-1/PfpI family protein [Fusobacterium ulcerans]RGY62707.1 DJ-1/PfpI family protein [Fusobacterium ulcerans]